MRKYVSKSISVLIVAAVAALALYAMGVFDNSSIMQVNGMVYDAGGFTYSGGFDDGSFSGHGTIDYLDGSSYNGGFTEGRFDGSAIYVHGGDDDESTWHFKGEFLEGYTGSGTFYLSDGSKVLFEEVSYTSTFTGPSWQYAGRYNENGQNGSGTFTFEDGSVYTGDFTDGLANWEGMFIDASGNVVYFGEIKNGLFDGTGIYYSPDGWSYEGGFKSGLFDGDGIVFDGDTVISGVWEKGVQITRYG